MKVILVQAPARNLKFNIGAHFKILPLSLAYIAKRLKDNNIDFDIFFPRRSRDFFGRFGQYLKLYKNFPSIVGISATLFSAKEAFRLARIAKTINSKNITVLGGPVTSFSAKSIFRYSNDVDYVIPGDGENVLSSLALALKNNLSIESITNLSYRNNSKLVSHTEEYAKDLDSIGIPLREIFPRWAHHLHPPMGRYSPAYLVETMRGCSFKCVFCAISNNLRFRSIAVVLDELQMLQSYFNAKEVYFIDATFTINRERTYGLCQQMINNNMKLHWSCMTRVDCVDNELLKIMKAAGCYLIHFGVESATAKILEKMNKKQSVENTINAFDECRRIGIRTGAFIILGSTIYDSNETVKEVVRLIKRIRPTYVLYDHVKPIPNGPLVREAIDNNVIAEEDVEEFYLGDKERSKLATVTVSGISRSLAQRWVEKASQSFYLSPRVMMNILLGLRTKNDWLNLCKGGIYFYREILKKNEW